MEMELSESDPETPDALFQTKMRKLWRCSLEIFDQRTYWMKNQEAESTNPRNTCLFVSGPADAIKHGLSTTNRFQAFGFQKRSIRF